MLYDDDAHRMKDIRGRTIQIYFELIYLGDTRPSTSGKVGSSKLKGKPKDSS